MQRAKLESSDPLREMPDKAAVALLAEVFALIGRYIEAADKGVIRVDGLGQFEVRQVKAEESGAKITVTRTLFRPEQLNGQSD